MIDKSPILIAAPPRSGTTMLAGLLNKHGVWVGNAKTTSYPGSNSNFGSENVDIKNIMKGEAENIGYRNWTVPLPKDCGNYEKIKEGIENFVPPNTKWLVKTSWTLVFYKFWDWAYPEAKWILLERDKRIILDSMNRHPSMRRRPNKMKINFVNALKDHQVSVLENVNNGIVIHVNKLLVKDKDLIKNLFNFIGIKPDYSVIDTWIDPKMMKR